MPMPTLQQIIGTITGKVAFERTQANFTTIKTAHDSLDTSLTTHKEESANKHINESGSNTNGRYIKFDDGTMIVSGTMSVGSTAISTTTGTLFRSANITIIYPAVFVASPQVANSLFGDTDIVVTGNTITTTQAVVRLMTTLNRTIGATSFINYIAIGRWK